MQIPKSQLSNELTFFIKNADEKLIETEAYTSPLICLPLQYQPLQIVQKHCKHLNLNFPDKGNLDGEIDLLIGSDNYWRFLTGELKLYDREGLVAVNFLFGWVLSGPIGVKSEELETTKLHSTHVLFSRDIAGYENSVSRFWDLRVLGISEKETPCYNHYIEDIRKNSENRYEVSLPFKENHPLIHDHFELSKKRLLNIYKRFKDDKEFLKQYDYIFKEQLEAGIIEEVTEEGEVSQTHYLPHHPVIRNDKATTKLRVVFDASAASKGPSFDICLYKGPQLT